VNLSNLLTVLPLARTLDHLAIQMLEDTALALLIGFRTACLCGNSTAVQENLLAKQPDERWRESRRLSCWRRNRVTCWLPFVVFVALHHDEIKPF
jgi:hypothetical protein